MSEGTFCNVRDAHYVVRDDCYTYYEDLADALAGLYIWTDDDHEAHLVIMSDNQVEVCTLKSKVHKCFAERQVYDGKISVFGAEAYLRGFFARECTLPNAIPSMAYERDWLIRIKDGHGCIWHISNTEKKAGDYHVVTHVNGNCCNLRISLVE